MRVFAAIARLLLGALFVFAGSNHLFHFVPNGPMPAGEAGQFLGALVSTGYLNIVGVLEAAAGLLLLINRFVPLALAVLGPIIVNILIVALLLTPKVLPVAIFLIIFWILAAYRARAAFLPFFKPRAAE